MSSSDRFEPLLQTKHVSVDDQNFAHFALSTCESLSESHIMLDYDEASQKFVIKLLDERVITVNGRQVKKEDGWIEVQDLDEIRFACCLHS